MKVRNLDALTIVEWLEDRKIDKYEIDYIKSRFDYMITLTFNFPPTFTPYKKDKVIKVIQIFKNHLSEHFISEFLFVDFVEDRTLTGRPEQIHVHLLFTPPKHNFSEDLLKIILSECWKKADKYAGKIFIKRTYSVGATIYSSKLINRWNTENLDLENICLAVN